MLKEQESVIRRAMIILDVCIAALSFFIAFHLRQHFHAFYKLDFIPSVRVVAEMHVSIAEYLVLLFFLVPIWSIMLYSNGMYRSMRTKTIIEIIWIILSSATLTVLAFGAIVFLFKFKFVSRMFFAIYMATSSLSLAGEKIIIFSVMHYVRRHGYNFRRLLIVGTGDRAASFIKKINDHPEWGFKIEGVLDYERNISSQKIDTSILIGKLDYLDEILHRTPIDEVIFIVPRNKLSEIEKSLYVCETEGVKATVSVDLFDLKIAKSRLTELDGIPLITFETTPAVEWQLFIKRAIDIIVSGFGLLILSPLFAIIALLIKITSPGPILFLQKRTGLNGRIFILYKFRTMYKDAQKQLIKLERLNEMKGPIFKIKKDPRITPVGRILRKFSLDEFPQLLNVFIGHMSLVGPRPPLAREVARYEPWQRRRLSMRPGLTCLWQISGRNKIGFEEWMKLDMEYLDTWSLWLDFKILVKTIPVVLFGIGAY